MGKEPLSRGDLLVCGGDRMVLLGSALSFRWAGLTDERRDRSCSVPWAPDEQSEEFAFHSDSSATAPAHYDLFSLAAETVFLLPPSVAGSFDHWIVDKYVNPKLASSHSSAPNPHCRLCRLCLLWRDQVL